MTWRIRTMEGPMANKEWRIPFDEIRNPETITQRNVDEFKRHGLDIHKNEVDELIDDHSRKERIYKVRDRKYFDMGRGKK